MAQSHRVDFVDALRGYAVLGLFLVHMSEMFELYWADPQPSVTHDAVFLIFAGKAYALLALCFGFSFQAMGDSALRRGEAFAGRFAWRVALLLVIGLLHGLIYRGDIIVVLAAEAFLLIPFFKVRSVKFILAVTAFCFISPMLLVRIAAGLHGAEWANAVPLFYNDPGMPAYLTGSFSDALSANAGPSFIQKWSFYIENGRVFHIFGLFLCGMLLGRSGFFQREASPATHGRRIAGTAASALLLYGLHAWFAANHDTSPGPGLYTATLLAGWFELAATVLSVVVLHALWQGAGRPLIGWLVRPGRMTLTLYIGQSLIFVPFFYGYGCGAYRWITQEQALAIGVVTFALQAWLAVVWFRHFHYGPFEWLWRAATRMTTAVPFRR